jgi:hypothetical protein
MQRTNARARATRDARNGCRANVLVSNDHHCASAASASSERRLSDDREHPQRSAARRAQNTCGATLGMYSSVQRRVLVY